MDTSKTPIVLTAFGTTTKAMDTYFHKHAMSRGLEAIKNGENIITDTNMARVGIRKSDLGWQYRIKNRNGQWGNFGGNGGRSNAGGGVTRHVLVFPQAAGCLSWSATVRNNRAVIKGEANLPSMCMSAKIKAGQVLSGISVRLGRVGYKEVECVFRHLFESQIKIMRSIIVRIIH